MADDDDIDIGRWIEVFQTSQAQLAEAHLTFQRALIDSHEAFVASIAESQRQLAALLGDRLPEDQVRELIRALETTDFVERSLRRRVPVAVEASTEGGGKPHKNWAFTRDSLGIAELAVTELNNMGFEARTVASWGEVRPSEGLVELSGIRVYQNADDAGALVVRVANRARKYGESRGESPTVFVQDTFGRFGLDICDPFKAFLGGLRGVSIALGRTTDGVRSIDLDVGHRLAYEVAPILVDEILNGSGRDIGRPDNERIALTWMEVDPVEAEDVSPGLVIVTTPVSERFRGAVLDYCDQVAEQVLLVGEEDAVTFEALSAKGTHVRSIDSSDISQLVVDLQIAVSGQRLEAVLHANDRAWGPGDLEDAYSHRIALMQVIMAATAAYGAELTAFLIAEDSGWAGAVFDEMLRRHAHAETQRQSEEGVTRAIVVGSAVPTDVVVGELCSGSVEPEVWLTFD